MNFAVDNRILKSSVWLGDGFLSSVYIKNDANFLWFILVPQVCNVTEIYQLNLSERNLLMEEIASLSSLINGHCNPDKLNVGALGNIVSQLHIHVIARFQGDAAWPHGVWQANIPSMPYEKDELAKLVDFWRGEVLAFKQNLMKTPSCGSV